MADSFHYKPDGEVLRQFMKCDDFWRGLRGPVGSGKSVGSAVELWRRALQQEPDSRGIRRTRWGIIRNTGPQLKTTTIKTWLDWFPEEVYGPFRWGVPYTHHIRVADVDMENIFLALDSEDDIRKLLSLELTGIWANEAREMPKAIIDACTMRVGRYPSMREGGPTWYGMIADTNAPEDDHWWAIMSGDAPLPEFISEEEALMLRKPEGWKFFTQPSAMLEIKDDEGHVIGYEKNPHAENINNLTPDYYPKIITGKEKDWIDVYIMNRLGTVSEGKPVYPSFTEESHMASDKIEVLPNRTLWVGLDFGFTPAMVVGQRLARGQWNIIREVCPDDISTPAFARLIKAELGELMATTDQPVRIYGDPSGASRSSGREDKKNVFQILRANGVAAHKAPTNDEGVRIDTVKDIIDRMVDGHPALRLSPTCSYLKKGFTSGYCYRRLGGSGQARYDLHPSKNKYSHPHDALQYLLLGAGEGRKIMHNKNQGKTKAKAKVGWNVFQKKRKRNKNRMSI
jgi:hypothetical protein